MPELLSLLHRRQFSDVTEEELVVSQRIPEGKDVEEDMVSATLRFAKIYWALTCLVSSCRS